MVDFTNEIVKLAFSFIGIALSYLNKVGVFRVGEKYKKVNSSSD